MLPLQRSFRRSPAVRRRVLLALAVAEERVAAAHVEAALGTLRAGGARLPLDQVLAIHCRLVGVPRSMRHSIGVRALARLGRTPDATTVTVVGSAPLGGLLGAVRRRLRGRRDEALRARLAAATVRARETVRAAYLEGARDVVEAVGELLSPVEAVQLFVDTVDTPPEWTACIFHEALARSGDAMNRTDTRDPNRGVQHGGS